MKNRAAPPALRVRLFGDAALLLSDGRSVALERRAAALVALAALEPEPGISRLRAATMLWPDSSDPRRNLRQQLLRFRQALGTPLLNGEDALRLAEGVVLEPAGAGAELLAGAAADGEFGLWLERQRAAALRALREPMQQALVRAEHEGELDAALRQAQDLLALEPREEAHHAALMRVYYLRGEPAAGLAAWRRLGEMLAATCGSRPGAASAQLAEALQRSGTQASVPLAAPAALRGAAGGPVGMRLALPVTLKRPPLLAGREAERAAVLQAWADGRAVLLEGEAGMGKSRLLADLLAGCGAALSGAGRPGDSGAPYATLARLLRPLLADGAATLDNAARQALSLLAPGLHGSAGSAVGAHPPRLRPGAMSAAVAALLHCNVVRTVALDDLHFADDATLDLLAGLATPAEVARAGPPQTCDLASAGDGAGILGASHLRWLFATRPAEASSAVRALRDGLAELHRLSVVALSPLDAAATATLIDSLGVQGLQGDTLAPALVRHTGGNPLYLLETLKLGLADGSLLAGRLPRPEAVGSLIERRLRQLSPRALSLARVAAVAGVDFGVELAEQTLAVPAVELSDAWAELQSAQVLRDDAFAHDLVVDAVLHSIAAPIAAHLHGQVAQWLSRRQGEPARVAAHWQAAGEHRHAADAWMAAAQVADRRVRFRESMQCYEQAAALFEELADAPARHGALTQAIDQAAMLGLDVAAYAAQVERLIASAPDPTARAAASVYRLRIHEMSGDHAALLRETDEVIALAQCHGLKRNEAVALFARGTVRGNLQQLAQALPDFERTAVLGAELGDLELQGASHAAQATMLLRLGHSTQALAEFDAARALFGRGDFKLRLAMVEQQTSIILLGSGRPAAALEAAERALGAALPIEPPLDMLAHCWLARAMALRQLGRYAESLLALDPHLGLLDAQGHAVADRVRLELAQTYLHLGRTDLAQRLLAQARAPERLAQAEQQRALYLELQLRALGNPLAQTAAAPLRPPQPQVEPRRRCELLRALSALVPVSERAGLLDEALRVANEFELTDERCSAQALMAQHLLHAGQSHAAAELVRLALADESITAAGYPPATAAIAHAAFSASGDAAAAQRVLARALDWVERASAALAPEFRLSFRERNPVNRALLAAAGAQFRPRA